MPETEKKRRNASISQLRNDILLQQTKHLQPRVVFPVTCKSDVCLGFQVCPYCNPFPSFIGIHSQFLMYSSQLSRSVLKYQTFIVWVVV